jgi:DNA-binding transcriptional ArsR family regulator
MAAWPTPLELLTLPAAPSRRLTATCAASHIINGLVNNQKRITAVFAALADPTRRRIVARLSDRAELPVTALAKPFRISPPAISRHLRVLERARLILRRRTGRIHLIRARPEGFQEAQRWINRYIAAWNFSFDRLDKLLEDERGKEDS